MILLYKDNKDPWFNLAAEEFAVKYLTDEVLMLWESDYCIVTGKHQLAYAEYNPELVFPQSIPVLRRISGGGTVVHAPGNLNYSLITDNRKNDYKIDFRKATQPIIEFLGKFGLKVKLTGVSNLSANELKISGNAAHVFKNKSLYHGTLLFDADLEKIQSLITRPEQPYQSKAIKSNPAQIANISQLIDTPLLFEEFKQLLEAYLVKTFSINTLRSFSNTETKSILRLVSEKYRTDEWNFGYSPDYYFNRKFNFQGNETRVSFVVHKGIIASFECEGNESLAQIASNFVGLHHTMRALSEKVSNSNISDVISASEINQFLLRLF